MKVYKTSTAQIFLRKDGIIQKKFLERTSETLDSALEAEAIIIRLCADKKRPMLVDFTTLRTIESKALVYYSSDRPVSLIAACGAITTSKTGKVVANFFIRFNRSPIPVKLFTSESEAVEFLKPFV